MYNTHYGPLITAVVTPFDNNYQVDIKQFEKLLRHLIDTGSTSLVITGTTGAGEYRQWLGNKNIIESIITLGIEGW